jgi:hypothetical protein
MVGRREGLRQQRSFALAKICDSRESASKSWSATPSTSRSRGVSGDRRLAPPVHIRLLMNNGSKILGLAMVIGLVGCLAGEEPSTLTGATPQGLTATRAPVVEDDDVEPAKRASDSSDDDATAARMPNIKHPDLTK